jgi:metal-responsive CopG/Arc/MetJ family transcriptional regulator
VATTSKKVYISVPEKLLQRLDDFARKEQRTRSGLIQEAVRGYLEAEEERRLARQRFFALADKARKNVARSGATQEEMDQLIQDAVEEVRAERKKPPSRGLA